MKTALIGLIGMLATMAGTSAFADQGGTPVTVIAIVKVKAGTEEAFKAAAVNILAPTRAEAGNLSYDFHQSTQDPTEFATYETWDSQAAVTAHMSAPHMQAFFTAVGPLFETGYPQINTYTKFEN